MKIGIIGGGASGVYTAIRIKELNPSFEVTIIERNDKLLKKVAVTGNGRCNYANLGDLKGKYNNPFANQIIENLKPEQIVANFERYGIHPTRIDNLIFPVSLTAQTVVLMLNKRLNELGVSICLNEKVIDYQNKNNKFVVKTENNEYAFDSNQFNVFVAPFLPPVSILVEILGVPDDFLLENHCYAFRKQLPKELFSH